MDQFSNRKEIIGLAIVSIILFIIILKYNQEHTLAYIVGKLIWFYVIAVILWALLSLFLHLFLKKNSWFGYFTSYYSFLILLIVAEAFYFPNEFRIKKNLRSATAANFMKTYEKFAATNTIEPSNRQNVNMNQSKIDHSNDQIKTINEANAILLSIYEANKVAIDKFNIKYEMLLKELHAILSLKNITTAKGITNAKALLNNYKVLNKERYDFYLSLSNAMNDSINKNIKDQAFLASYKASVSQNIKVIQTITNIDLSIIENLEKYINLIERNLNDLKVTDDSIYFNKSDSAKEYNLLINNISQLESQKDQLITYISKLKIDKNNIIKYLK